jgi:DNA processing protein
MNRRQPSPQFRRDWLRLARTDNVGAVTFDHLIRRHRDPAAALDALPGLVRRGGGPDVKIPSVGDIQREIDLGEAAGARLLIACEDAFPRMLAALDPPPPVIWVRGEPSLLSRPCVAVVGARIASAAGQRFAQGLAADLGRSGYLIVSGLARGIDAAAHQGALATGTGAVLAGGVDDAYPPENRALYGEIGARGCLVSERPMGYRAQARDFPRRNRLISGLSLGVIVVEAEIRSGSLITARLAGEQGREVFAVPGSPIDPRAAGCNDLLRQGATLCAEVDDVLRVLDALPRLREPDGPAYRAFDGEPAFDAETDPVREMVADLLSAAPVSRDDLVRMTGAPAPLVGAALIELELAGRAQLLPGGLASLA